jgi:hypothetical protein
LGASVERDDDFSLSVACFQIPDRRGDLTQLVTPVYNRFHLSGLYEIAQEVGLVLSAPWEQNVIESELCHAVA